MQPVRAPQRLQALRLFARLYSLIANQKADIPEAEAEAEDQDIVQDIT